MWLRLILILALAGCGDAPVGKSAKTKQDRQQAAELALSKTPETRSYRIDGNELKVIQTPVRDALGFVELQRCFVWRDAEFKTASLQCPADQGGAVALDGPEPDHRP